MTAQELGKLQATAESLSQTLLSLAQSVTELKEDRAARKVSNDQTAQNIAHLDQLLRGPDGQSGILGRLAAIEGDLKTFQDKTEDLEKVLASTKSTLYKVAAFFLASGLGGGAGAEKLLAIFGGQ